MFVQISILFCFDGEEKTYSASIFILGPV